MRFSGAELDHFNMGFDIEYAVLNTKGKCVSSIPFIPGTKDEPWCTHYGNLQRDNIALEIAVNYTPNLKTMLDWIKDTLQQAVHSIPRGYTLECVPSVVVDPKELKHIEAKTFGCDADYDAKTSKANDMTANLAIVDPNLRSFGYHVHTEMPCEDDRLHVLASDLVLGLYSVMKDNSAEAQRRRMLYGKPSCYRSKPYGVEYRTLSNYWSKSPRLVKTIWYLNQIAYTITVSQPEILLTTVDMNEVADVILRGDDAMATELFYKIVWSKCDWQLKKSLQDELEFDNYGSLAEEWLLDTTHQKAYHDCLRHDYYAPPKITNIMGE